MSSKHIILSCMSLLWLGACADFERGPRGPSAGGGGPTGAVSFAAAVEPILLSRCQGCHQSGGVAGGSGFVLSGNVDTDFAAASALIDESAPTQSLLLQKPSGQTSHGGGTVLATSSSDYQTIEGWIAGGALP